MFDIQTTAPYSSETLKPLTFSSDAFAPSDALDAWRAWFGDLNEIVPEEGAAFEARVDYWRLGRFVLGSNVSSPMRLVRTPERARRDGLDHWVLRVSRRGLVRTRVGDLTYVSRPGEIVLERLSGCYADHWSADAWVALIFAPGIFPEIDRTLETRGAGPFPTGARSTLLADFMFSLDRHVPRMTRADLPAVTGATRAMIAALSPGEPAASPRAMSAARLRAERVIRANLGSARLDTQRIAALCDVSLSTLYRLFEGEGGVAAHVRRLRLDAVHAALLDPDQKGRPIATLAAEAGLHCVSSFNRSFKSRFGASPGDVRADGAATARGAEIRGGGGHHDFLDSLFGKDA